VQVTVWYLAGCPNWRAAGQRLRQALDQVGRADVPIMFAPVETDGEAAAVGFAGSPTVTVDGADLFDTAASTGTLACRIYPTSAGLVGVPEVSAFGRRPQQEGDVMTRPVDTVPDTGLRRCGCCGRQRPADEVAELGVTPGVYICAGCALWAARRAGLLSAVRQIQFRALLPNFLNRAPAPHTAKAAIPILPSSDLGRTAAFYARAGFADVGRHDDYLLLDNEGVELHFAHHDTVTPGTCFVHVTDATKMWKQLRDLGVDGVGEIADRDYGLREFVLTDPDGNRIRIGSPQPDRR